MDRIVRTRRREEINENHILGLRACLKRFLSARGRARNGMARRANEACLFVIRRVSATPPAFFAAGRSQEGFSNRLLEVGERIENTGKAQNVYEITSKSEKKICMRRINDGMEHCMYTARALDMINMI